VGRSALGKFRVEGVGKKGGVSPSGIGKTDRELRQGGIVVSAVSKGHGGRKGVD